MNTDDMKARRDDAVSALCLAALRYGRAPLPGLDPLADLLVAAEAYVDSIRVERRDQEDEQ